MPARLDEPITEQRDSGNPISWSLRPSRMIGDTVGQWVTIQRQSNSNDAIQGADGGQGSTTPLWYGLLTPSFDGPVSSVPWMLGGKYNGIALYSQKFVAIGTVIVNTSIDISDYELGFAQTLIASQFLATYVDSTGTPTQTLNITSSILPVRDGFKGEAPWCKRGDVKGLSAPDGYRVAMEDRPRQTIPWSSPDGQGTLASSSGNDAFCTWLVARQKSTGDLQFLSWVEWGVDWGWTFDPVAMSGTPTSAGCNVVNTGDGQGPDTPILVDPVANDVGQVTWGGPP